MIRVFGNTKLSNAELRTQLALPFAAMGRYDGAVVRLFKNDITPDRTTVLADLTEADFAGYAASSAVVWGAVFSDENDAANVVGGSKQFQASGPVSPAQQIYGYYVTNAAGDTLYWAERFDQPKEVNGAEDAIIVVPGLKLGHQE